ncbi:uncharacterized protein PFL1_03011 [Pseudozyma flocculosa PF-1]|uniref:Uncharacterized protein n=2 Tax=Pseudozyma flocculosa TaxID=84751 RepID=A0A5C3EZZ5_9BASI|nr:uncharacterized protein PFL1_03011 [Pseudozyma flocculosa PF-1]EPQ29256.1 hypothetical protein PFL1_03011 [Pseudozyma flocculosa PF-1]SPO37758.1 uncharacterized protein PSFLO_03234 [Pseudozyma flocculosa]
MKHDKPASGGGSSSLRRSPRKGSGTPKASPSAQAEIEMPKYIPDPALSRSEQMRAEVRFKLEQKKELAAIAARRAASDEDSDEEFLSLPVLTTSQKESKMQSSSSSPAPEPEPTPSRSGRPQRRAAAQRSYAYDADHAKAPAKPLSLTPADASLDRRYAMQNLLKERRKEQKGTDGQGRFARADAIALELRREADAAVEEALREKQEQRRKLAEPFASSGRQHRAGEVDSTAEHDGTDELEASIYWSSDDSCSTCASLSTSASFASAREVPPSSSPSKGSSGKLFEGPSSPAPAAVQGDRPAPGTDPEHNAIVDVLMSHADDELEGKAILDIVKRDLDPDHEDPLHGPRSRGRTRKSFWRSCRVKRPDPNDMCSDAASDHLTRLLLSGALPLLYSTLPTSTQSLCKWLFFRWVLSEKPEVRQRSHEAFADLIQRHVTDDEREAIIDTIAAQLPKLLVLLGAKLATVIDCFSLGDDQLDIEAPASIDRRSDAARGSQDQGSPWLTRTELWNIVNRLAQAVRVVSNSSHTQPKRPSDYVEGVFVSLLLVRSELHYGGLRDEIGQTLSHLLVEFSPFSVSNHAGGDVGVDCSKMWDVLRRESIEGRLEVLRAFPADNYVGRTIRRWLAWRSLMGDDEVAAQRGLRYVIPELGRLAAIIDHADPASPFYVSPPSEDRKSEGIKTDYATLSAATELMCVALSDMGLQICKPKGYADTPGPGSPPKRKDVAAHSRALDLALAPYRFLEPKRRSRRIEAMRAIVERLKLVNMEVSDLRDSTLARARAKDALLRLYLSLDYQITMYAARPHKLEEEEAPSKVGLAGKVPRGLDGQLMQKLAGSSGRSGDAAEGQAKQSLPRFAMPVSPSKERVNRQKQAKDGDARQVSPSRSRLGPEGSQTTGERGSCSSSSFRSASETNAGRGGTASAAANVKDTPKRARPPGTPTKSSKKPRGVAEPDGKQRKLTSFFAGRPEVVVLAPRSSSPTSLRGGKVAVDASGGDDEVVKPDRRRRGPSADGADDEDEGMQGDDDADEDADENVSPRTLRERGAAATPAGTTNGRRCGGVASAASPSSTASRRSASPSKRHTSAAVAEQAPPPRRGAQPQA